MNDVERIDEQNRQLALKLVTEREYWSLPAWSRGYLDWAARWMPKTCARLKKRGELVEWFTEKGAEIVEILEENYWTLGMAGGLEIVKEQYMSNPEA